jgi:2-polyprenyl-6-hydroxyphenyl methylase/3-demethylubiquinone-9 3-methyltransferase
MWRALELVAPLVRPGGQLFVALYNDQGTPSRRWLTVKKWYNRLPDGLRFLVVWPSFLFLHGRPLIKDFLQLRPFHSLRTYDKGGRGMSPWRDLIDWVGGYPFEVARPEELLDFYRQRGFELERLKTTNDLGCNEWVFRRSH